MDKLTLKKMNKMKFGDKTRIAVHSNLSNAVISKFFNGHSVTNQTKHKILKAMEALGIDYKIPDELKYHKPKISNDRYDIYNNLPYGALTKLAKKGNCSVSNVKYVLEGRREDNFGIIKEAELMAAINIWKTRFCKFKSQL